MTPDERIDSELDEVADEGMAAQSGAHAADDDDSAEAPERLELKVSIAVRSACERHVTVTISRADVDRYFDDAFGELMPSAAVPGFRVGRAPRKLVENRYRQEIGKQIKGTLLMDSLAQIGEENSFTAISEPELDIDAIEVPEEGPMTFEFDIEVRPEFDLPNWKGLKIERPVRDFTDQDVTRQLEQILARYGQLVPVDRPVEAGDYVTVNIVTSHQGRQVVRENDRVIIVHPQLSFLDAQLEEFDALMAGAKPGETRSVKVVLSKDAPREALRGEEVEVSFEILDVKGLRLPDLTPDFLAEMGKFESVDELRNEIRESLKRQLEYEQQRIMRRQITAELTRKANWELPPALLKRQSARELQRAAMELRRSGFSDQEIRARENHLRQNSAASTARALKEHFILERIAEEEGIEAKEADFELEMQLIAAQSGESVRRVRAQIEKRGLTDVLQNQIIERKVLELVHQHARFTEIPFTPTEPTIEALALALGGDESPIPSAQEPGERSSSEQGSNEHSSSAESEAAANASSP